ncbi:MFS transporter, YNFM family, putative membrane transport protein [Arboricoccus pini]|uniref:MFS transporter, YNFM family, putative membrane transport protein n=1 Tax=Arboricoccus pini TaxID=1963835 RepID=A0A212R6J6_9PROT|nr:MFS transporter [Arboricoccus pini]SNB67745.1 MFS transporter, YNFM family, putative membrane transport protein [Arboricoccus pini]
MSKVAPLDDGASRPTLIRVGTIEYRRAAFGLFLGGFATFALLYNTQPLFPMFTEYFGLGAASASLALSVTTGTVGIGLVFASSLSEVVGRKGIMTVSIILAACFDLLAAFSPTFGLLLLFRALEGIALSGLPAVGMAYLAEEVEPTHLGAAMGIYIGGNAIGGLGGRLITSILADYASWRVALGSLGALSLVIGIAFWNVLPESRHFTARSFDPPALMRSLLHHFADPGLRLLFATGFLLMGSFVSVYNYLGFRLTTPPYNLSQTAVGVVFIVYSLGILSSAWAGKVADRLGRRRVLWVFMMVMLLGLLLTALSSLAFIFLGVALLTAGFFAAHSIASSWVGRRARVDRAQASSLYLLAYYMGSSIVGTSTGLAWSSHGWAGVTTVTGGLLLLAVAVGLRLRKLEPLPL